MARVRIEDRYTCETEGCHEPVALIGYVKDKDGNNTGWADYRKVCIKCHNKKTAAKHGLKKHCRDSSKKPWNISQRISTVYFREGRRGQRHVC